jgi:CubicO group peptidase (beta-lactamase class C family)
MQTKKLLCAIINIGLAGLLGGCTGNPAANSTGGKAAPPAYWPDAGWRATSPEAQGIDSAAIIGMLQEIRQSNLNIHSVLIIRHGYLVTEVYFPPYTSEIRHPMHSITKSVTSAMTGIAIRDGHIKNVRQKVLDFFPEIEQETKDPNLKGLTLEHLLTMSAGYNTSTLPDYTGRGADFDAAAYILTHSDVLWKPGKTFFYDSGLPHVVSAVIQKTSGRTLSAYAQTELFAPLGITEYSWQSDPQGVTYGYSGLSLRPCDMVKLGYLYLHNGEWNGKPIVSPEWVRASTVRQMETKGLMNAAEEDGFGYYWWFDSFGGFSAHGHGGQYVFVLPALDMVVGFTAGIGDSVFPEPHRLLRKWLLPAAQSAQPMAENTGLAAGLAAEIEQIQNPQKPAAALPEIAKQISGQVFRITGGAAAGMPSEIMLTFPGGDTFTTSWIDPQETLTADGGLDNVFRLTKRGASPERLMALRGYWRDDHTFVEEGNFDLYSEIQFFTVTYEFDGNRLTMTVESGMGYFPPMVATGEMVG